MPAKGIPGQCYPNRHSQNFDVDISISIFQCFFDVFSTPSKKPLKYRRRVDVERQNVDAFFDGRRNIGPFSNTFSTSNRRQKCPLGRHAISMVMILHVQGITGYNISKSSKDFFQDCRLLKNTNKYIQESSNYLVCYRHHSVQQQQRE